MAPKTDWEAEYNKRGKELEDLEISSSRKINSLTKKIEPLERKITELEELARTRKKEIDSIKADADARSRAVDGRDLSKEVEALKSERERQNRINKLSLDAITHKLTEAEDQVRDLEKELQKQKDDHANMVYELQAENEQKLRENEGEHKKAIERHDEFAHDWPERWEENQQSHKAELRALEAQADRKRRDEEANAKQQLAEKDAQLAAKEAERKESEDILKTALAANAELQAHNATLMAKNEEEAAKVDRLLRARSPDITAAEPGLDAEVLDIELKDIKAENQELKTALGETKDKFTKLYQENEEVKKELQDVKSLKETIQRLEQEKSCLVDEQSKSASYRKTLTDKDREERIELERKAKEVNERAERAEKNADDAENQAKEFQKEKYKAERETNRAKRHAQDLQSHNNELVEEIRKKDIEIKSQEKSYQELEELTTKAVDEKDKALRTLKKLEQEARDLRGNAVLHPPSRLVEEVVQLKQRETTNAFKIQTLRQANNDQSKQITQLKDEKRDLETEIERLHNENSDIRPPRPDETEEDDPGPTVENIMANVDNEHTRTADPDIGSSDDEEMEFIPAPKIYIPKSYDQRRDQTSSTNTSPIKPSAPKASTYASKATSTSSRNNFTPKRRESTSFLLRVTRAVASYVPVFPGSSRQTQTQIEAQQLPPLLSPNGTFSSSSSYGSDMSRIVRIDRSVYGKYYADHLAMESLRAEGTSKKNVIKVKTPVSMVEVLTYWAWVNVYAFLVLVFVERLPRFAGWAEKKVPQAVRCRLSLPEIFMSGEGVDAMAETAEAGKLETIEEERSNDPRKTENTKNTSGPSSDATVIAPARDTPAAAEITITTNTPATSSSKPNPPPKGDEVTAAERQGANPTPAAAAATATPTDMPAAGPSKDNLPKQKDEETGTSTQGAKPDDFNPADFTAVNDPPSQPASPYISSPQPGIARCATEELRPASSGDIVPEPLIGAQARRQAGTTRIWKSRGRFPKPTCEDKLRHLFVATWSYLLWLWNPNASSKTTRRKPLVLQSLLVIAIQVTLAWLFVFYLTENWERRRWFGVNDHKYAEMVRIHNENLEWQDPYPWFPWGGHMRMVDDLGRMRRRNVSQTLFI